MTTESKVINDRSKRKINGHSIFYLIEYFKYPLKYLTTENIGYNAGVLLSLGITGFAILWRGLNALHFVHQNNPVDSDKYDKSQEEENDTPLLDFLDDFFP